MTVNRFSPRHKAWVLVCMYLYIVAAAHPHASDSKLIHKDGRNDESYQRLARVLLVNEEQRHLTLEVNKYQTPAISTAWSNDELKMLEFECMVTLGFVSKAATGGEKTSTLCSCYAKNAVASVYRSSALYLFAGNSSAVEDTLTNDTKAIYLKFSTDCAKEISAAEDLFAEDDLAYLSVASACQRLMCSTAGEDSLLQCQTYRRFCRCSVEAARDESEDYNVCVNMLPPFDPRTWLSGIQEETPDPDVAPFLISLGLLLSAIGLLVGFIQVYSMYGERSHTPTSVSKGELKPLVGKKNSLQEELLI